MIHGSSLPWEFLVTCVELLWLSCRFNDWLNNVSLLPQNGKCVSSPLFASDWSPRICKFVGGVGAAGGQTLAKQHPTLWLFCLGDGLFCYKSFRQYLEISYQRFCVECLAGIALISAVAGNIVGWYYTCATDQVDIAVCHAQNQIGRASCRERV